MIHTNRFICVSMCICICNALAIAQTLPATQPAIKPVVKTAVPNGYVRIEVQGRSLICLPDDKDWITQVASRIKKDIGPTTRPADLLQNLATKRDRVVAGLLKDLPALNPSQIDELIDQKILPVLKELNEIRPKIVYLVTPAEHLKLALKGGWKDPRVRLNGVTDTLDMDRSVSLGGPRSDDESTVAAIFNPSDTVSQRTELLNSYIVNTEQQIGEQIAGRGTTLTLVQFADFIAAKALNDLPRQEDQVWMVSGLSNVLAARYVSMIHGSPTVQFIEAMIVAPQQTPVPAAGMDLLHPLPLASLKEEFIPTYLDSRRRKSIAVMFLWLKDVGDEKLLPTIEAVARAHPADGATLVRVIKDVSQVDLTEALKPR